MTDSGFRTAASPSSRSGIGTQPKIPPVPKLAFLCIFVIVLPLSFSVGPLSLSLSRVLFLVMVPILTIRLLQGKYGKITIVDILVYFHVFWLSLSIFINNPDVAVTFTGSNAIAILGGYLVARCTIRTADHFRAVCRLLVFAVLLSLPFGLIETLTGRTVLRDVFNALPGIGVGGRATDEQRLGLYRVQFLFAHPIHYGFFCSLVFSLGFMTLRGYVNPARRLVVAGLVGFCCFMSLSSGAVLAMAIQAFLMGWQRATQSVPNQWRLLLIGTLAFYIVAEIGSNRPAIIAILSRVAFNPMTISIRQRLFEFGTEQIGKTPVFGVGYNDWGLPPWMSGSIDNFWLLQALIYGVPSFLALSLAAVLGMVLVSRRDFSTDEGLRNCRLGWIFTMVGMCLTLATVAVWGEIHSFIMFVIGSGIFMLTVQAGKTEETSETPVHTNTIRYSRFDPIPATRQVG